ncbi:hypothetical protein ACLOJK_029931 [Asimina triloba]
MDHGYNTRRRRRRGRWVWIRHLPRSIGSDDVKLELRPKVSSKCDRCGWKERRKQLRSWSYVSTCGGYCFHVSCVKEAILERWEKVRFGNVDHDDDDDNEGDEDGESSCSTALALENTASGLGSGLQLVVQNNGGSGGKLGRYWRILKMALKFVISVIVGDPTGIVGGLITSLFSP